ncbi:hypothetical protein IFM89_029776 [Coptis chinensis]|uniref:Pentatricopeptide repeat-containing protein n=1 Tax=Coptis chinensis TaxID=261450 RepID=A0A835M7D6_9MAGN|nr:hypothetical protein IFM89_029776 [Coptis chinensis]
MAINRAATLVTLNACKAFIKNVNGFNGGISRGLRQNHPNGGYSTSPQGSSLEFQGNRNESYASNVVGLVNENTVGCNVKSNANYGGSFQDNTTGSYTGSVQGFNNSTNGYQGSGGFNMNTNGLPRRVGDSSTPMSFGLNSRSVEAAEKIQYVGTIEELDGFCKENKVKDAVEVLTVLENNGIIVDLPRYLLLMQICGEIGVLQYAKTVHDHLIRSLGHVNLSVHNKVLEMYSSCGSMSDAFDVFEKMNERNLTSWDTMITGLAKNGCGEDAIDLFTRFKGMGLTPDGQMFVGVFLACGVLFDIDEGMLHFESMSKVYGIVPTMEHYLSVVNMLGSTGCLEEAMEFIEKMPFDPNVEVWESLMNLCIIHAKESELEKEGEKKKRSDDLRDMRSKVQEYRAGDTCHPENYSLLKGMSAQMKEAGYVPELRQVLHDVD